jgi:hypothetical protein
MKTLLGSSRMVCLAALLGACNGGDASDAGADATTDVGAGDAANDVTHGDALASDAGSDALDAGCLADVSSDPQNCGRCGHSCLGGACEAGVCQPYLIATINGAGSIASDGVAVDWVAPFSTGKVYECPRTGCADAAAPLVSNTPTPAYVATSATDVLWTTYVDDGGVLARCAKTGCNDTPTILSGGHVYPANLVVDANDVFFNVYNGDIDRCALSGCDGGASSIVASQNGPMQGLAQTSSELFWTEGYDYVVGCSKSACTSTRHVLGHGFSTNLDSAATYGGNVYVSEDKAQGSVFSCPTASTTCTGNVVAQNLDRPAFVAADADGVFIVTIGTKGQSYFDGKILRCPLGGCTQAPARRARHLLHPVRRSRVGRREALTIRHGANRAHEPQALALGDHVLYVNTMQGFAAIGP